MVKSCRLARTGASGLLTALLLVFSASEARANHNLFVACGIPGITCQTKINLDTLQSTVLPTVLTRAESLAAGSDGLLYVGLSGYAESGIRQIVRFDQQGENLEVLLDWDTTPELIASGGPEGLSFSPDGELFFNTRRNDGVLVHTGAWKLPKGGGPPVQVLLPYTTHNAEATAFLRAPPYAGHFIAADYQGGRIVRIAPPFDAPQTAIDFISGATEVNGIAVNSAGEVYAALELSGLIVKFAPDGTPLGTFAEIDYCFRKLTFDEDDRLYASTVEGPVFRFEKDGTSTIIGDVLEGNGLGIFAKHDEGDTSSASSSASGGAGSATTSSSGGPPSGAPDGSTATDTTNAGSGCSCRAAGSGRSPEGGGVFALLSLTAAAMSRRARRKIRDEAPV